MTMRTAIRRPAAARAHDRHTRVLPLRARHLAIGARSPGPPRLMIPSWTCTGRHPPARDHWRSPFSIGLIEQRPNTRRDLGGLEKHHAEIDGLPRRHRENTVVTGLNEQHRAMFALDHDAL